MLITLYSLCFITSCVIGKPQIATPRPPEHHGNQTDGMSGQGNSILNAEIGPRNVRVEQRYRWHKGNVPFYLDVYGLKLTLSELPHEYNGLRSAMKKIMGVLAERGINDGTCQIVFTSLAESQPPPLNYLLINIDSEGLCTSEFVGKKGGKQILYLGPSCLDEDIIIHELLHVLGMDHQHSSHNRNQHVDVHEENIKEGEEYNFKKRSSLGFTSFGLGYDYDSIMHYGPEFFARKGSDGKAIGPVLTARDPNRKLKENTELSDGDKTKLNFMYCKDHTPPGWQYKKKEMR